MNNFKTRLVWLLLAAMVGRAGAMQLKMVLWNDNAVRIRIVPGTEAPGLPELSDFNGLSPRAAAGKVIELSMLEGQKEIKLGDWRAQVTTAPLKICLRKNGRLVQTLEGNATNGAITFASGNGPVLGLGEGGQQFDRRGGFYPVKNGQAENTRKWGARIAVPLLIGTEGWAMFFNTPPGEFDLRGERGVFQPIRSDAPPAVDLFVFDASDPAVLMGQMAQLTGPAVLPPKWALGYMQSHRTLESSAQMLGIADTFRQKQLPCDALIYLGTGFCPAGWNTNHDSFVFNQKNFGEAPVDFIQGAHERNFHVVLHTVPPRVQLHGSVPPARDETVDDAHIASYWVRHQPVFALGVDGWWPDEGDWMNVPARLARHRMYYEAAVADRPDVRPWSLHRNGCAGIARYGGWVWSGDVDSRWATLAAQVSVGLNSSLSLSPYWGTDTGGFIPTRELTGELYARWFQFSVFCPSFRSHGRTWQLRLPWGWNTGATGPVEEKEFPSEAELHNAAVEPVCRKYLNLRYQLLPYNYTLAREARDTGMPFMRALWLHYPADREAVRQSTEYLWGRDLLIAPVVELGATQRSVYLPAGDWYDWWTGKKVGGGQSVQRLVDLATMPIYVRAGAIIPLDPIRQFVTQPVAQPTTLRVYAGADGKFVLYDDDGSSLEYLAGKSIWTSFTWKNSAHRLVIETDARTLGPPRPRSFEVVLLPENIHQTVEFTGRRQVLTLGRQ